MSKDFEVIFANNFLLRIKGLYFADKNSIAIIYPCKDIHTWFFKKSIDVAFISKEGIVLKSIRNLSPWSRVKVKDSYYVIERFSNDKLGWFIPNYKFK